MRFIKLLYLLFCLFFIFSCQKDKNPISAENGEIEFPMNIGSNWKYSVTDTIIHTHPVSMEILYDKVDVKIIDSKVLSNGNKAMIWQYNYRNTIDSIFVSQSFDTLYFYNDDKYLNIQFGIIFPLELNKKWQLSTSDYKVFIKDTLYTSIGLFTDVFQLKEYSVRVGNTTGYNEYFIVPQIGIVRYKYGIFTTLSEINHNSEWKILSYNIIN